MRFDTRQAGLGQIPTASPQAPQHPARRFRAADAGCTSIADSIFDAGGQWPPIRAGAGAAERRATLIARREARQRQRVYRFERHLQGDKETVFFDI